MWLKSITDDLSSFDVRLLETPWVTMLHLAEEHHR